MPQQRATHPRHAKVKTALLLLLPGAGFGPPPATAQGFVHRRIKRMNQAAAFCRRWH